MKKAEGPIVFTQSPAQGDQEDDDHASNVDREQAAHGQTPTIVSGPNDNQGGK